jgi:hypothetical protein
MRKLLILCVILITIQAQAQQKKYVAVALTTNATSYPFSYLAGYTQNPIHPGFELTYGKNFSVKGKHDWFREFKLGYFYHQYVQHGIPIYINYGYRYHFSKHFHAEAAAGAGYLHSISEPELLEQDDNGEYVNGKGIGKPQFMAALTIGLGYHIGTSRIFLQYQARIQTPFIKSYVPILPYDQLALGLSMPLTYKKK